MFYASDSKLMQNYTLGIHIIGRYGGKARGLPAVQGAGAFTNEAVHERYDPKPLCMLSGAVQIFRAAGKPL